MAIWSLKPPSNVWFLGPIRAYPKRHLDRFSTSHRRMSLYFTIWATTTPPLEIAHFHGGIWTPSNIGPIITQPIDSVLIGSIVLQGSLLWQTDRPTVPPTRSVTTGRLHCTYTGIRTHILLYTAMRPKIFRHCLTLSILLVLNNFMMIVDDKVEWSKYINFSFNELEYRFIIRIIPAVLPMQELASRWKELLARTKCTPRYTRARQWVIMSLPIWPINKLTVEGTKFFEGAATE